VKSNQLLSRSVSVDIVTIFRKCRGLILGNWRLISIRM